MRFYDIMYVIQAITVKGAILCLEQKQKLAMN